jgi:hypothetical protein
MKSFLISAVTAGYALVGFVLVAAQAQNLPLVFESLWVISTKMTYDPLLVAAIMLTTILVLARTLDFVRNRLERRIDMAAMA